jgi:arginine exporter protein ArgO
MVEFTIPLVLDIIRTAGILVAIVYYITIMRNQQRTRELSLKAQEEAEKARQREMIIQRSQTYGLDESME